MKRRRSAKELLKILIARINQADACFDIYPYYGKAPHTHSYIFDEKDNSKALVTVEKPREEWPDNFIEDADCRGFGVWFCPDKECKIKNCGGRIRR
jgi:hypothetical protein